VIEKVGGGRQGLAGRIDLKSGQIYSARIEYFHEKGAAVCHMDWSGPDFDNQRFRLSAAGFAQPSEPESLSR
jgi:hypothetical protein